MNKKLYYLLIIAILLLDFAALDDITTGNEPSFVGEYLTILSSVPIIFYLYKAIRRK